MAVSHKKIDSNRTKNVVINDIVVVASIASQPPYNPAGEFGDPTHFGGVKPPDNESPEQRTDRIYNAITNLMNEASEKHRESNCVPGSNELLPDKNNNITRVVTNEFFFYTKEPLTIDEFQNLQQKIADFAKQKPENLHLVLGSFAVKTPDNKVMNVVAQIECGSKPVINFTVKNNPSSIDPVYQGTPNVDKGLGHDISNLNIKIDGESCPFSFNNIIKCKSAGGTPFYSCIDICLDHSYEVAINNFKNKMTHDLANPHRNEEFPTQLSNIVLSNCVGLIPKNCLGNVTHADPHYSHINCKNGVSSKHDTQNYTVGFGTPSQMYVIDPTPCDKLAQEYLEKINAIRAIDQLRSAIDEVKKENKGYITPTGINAMQALFKNFDRIPQPTHQDRLDLVAKIKELAEQRIKEEKTNRGLLVQDFYVKLAKFDINQDNKISKTDIHASKVETTSLIRLKDLFKDNSGPESTFGKIETVMQNKHLTADDKLNNIKQILESRLAENAPDRELKSEYKNLYRALIHYVQDTKNGKFPDLNAPKYLALDKKIKEVHYAAFRSSLGIEPEVEKPVPEKPKI